MVQQHIVLRGPVSSIFRGKSENFAGSIEFRRRIEKIFAISCPRPVIFLIKC